MGAGQWGLREEQLRVTGKLAEAASVTALASCLLDYQPVFKRTCEEFLNLIAQDLPAEECERAKAAVANMKASEGVALAKQALGL